MPRSARVVVPDLPHHVAHRGNDRQDLFFSDEDRRFYLNVLADQAERYQLEVEAYCLMSNHVHLVVVPRNPRSLELAVGRAHHRFAVRMNERYDRCGHVWHERFFSCPMDETHHDRALRYVEQNPVRAGIVEQAWHYPWSSAAARCGDRPRHRILRDGEVAMRRGPEEWREWLAVPIEDADLQAIRAQTIKGRPLASESFIERLEARLNRRLHPRPVGRPRKDARGEKNP